MKNKQYSDKWQKRFAFFEQHGAPSDPGFRPALKALPNWRDRNLIAVNRWVLFFAPIYMATHGLWKKLLSWIALALIAGIVCAMLPDSIAPVISRCINIALSILAALSVNYAYYQKEKLGIQTWNPIEGLRFF
ncbi:DUF2628 domain-containing protein [Stenotrophomonas sp. HMWF023]|uniref:DUF2628 domain-containing protein n=1 Tax=Stenotrophomonas sp. HMWF023 TaxID=2056859 RepID=UPI0015E85F6A|nr:DUF2628 domain-containing protein [Stenotrophomonas sp. HMWF023]